MYAINFSLKTKCENIRFLRLHVPYVNIPLRPYMEYATIKQ